MSYKRLAGPVSSQSSAPTICPPSPHSRFYRPRSPRCTACPGPDGLRRTAPFPGVVGEDLLDERRTLVASSIYVMTSRPDESILRGSWTMPMPCASQGQYPLNPAVPGLSAARDRVDRSSFGARNASTWGGWIMSIAELCLDQECLQEVCPISGLRGLFGKLRVAVRLTTEDAMQPVAAQLRGR